LKPIVPSFSAFLVAALLVLTVILFSRLIQRVNDLQITNVLNIIGDRGREVIREMFQKLDERTAPGDTPIPTALGPVTQTLRYLGEPRTIATLDLSALVRQASQTGAVIA
jgi:hypothetical protein